MYIPGIQGPRDQGLTRGACGVNLRIFWVAVEELFLSSNGMGM